MNRGTKTVVRVAGIGSTMHLVAFGDLGAGAADAVLVAPRVSHCDLRGPKRATLVGPAEGCRTAVVILDERDDATREVVHIGELPSAEQPTLQDGEEQLDLVQP